MTYHINDDLIYVPPSSLNLNVQVWLHFCGFLFVPRTPCVTIVWLFSACFTARYLHFVIPMPSHTTELSNLSMLLQPWLLTSLKRRTNQTQVEFLSLPTKNHKQGSLNYPFWRNQSMQMCCNFEGFPL